MNYRSHEQTFSQTRRKNMMHYHRRKEKIRCLVKFEFILLLVLIAGAIQPSYSQNVQGDERNKPYNLLSPNCPSGKEPKSKPIPWHNFSGANGYTDSMTTHAIIPCDTAVIIPSGAHLVFDGGLAIRGKLVFEDGGDPITIEASFILVMGWIKIGTSQESFKSKVTFILKDHPDKAGLRINEGLPKPYDFGRKAFVVLGGKIAFHGADINAPAYVPMVESAMAGGNRIVVEGDVQTYWKKGDTVAIASSSYKGDLTSTSVIKETRVMMRGTVVTEITLEQPFYYNHLVRTVERTDQPKSIISLRPEVVNLTRNIVIRGSHPDKDVVDMKAKEPFLGGHFIMTHTAFSQVVEGVEFIHMGQAGIAERFPINYHFGGHVTEKSRIIGNSIHDSFQRCIVVHATHDLKISKNVAYNTHGHCYMTEDGIETGNHFIGNIAMSVNPALRTIPVSFGDSPTDAQASGFWFAGPNNHVIDNVVAGAFNTGYWFESFSYVGGESFTYKLPGYDGMDMKKESFGEFKNNVAHSVSIGLNPGYGSEPHDQVIFQDFFSWSVGRGFHSSAGTRLGLSGATIVDFLSCGISAIHSNGFILKDAIIIGELDKPKECGIRHVTGLTLSPAPSVLGKPVSAFMLENIHFQKLSTFTNCQQTNTGIEIFSTKDETWGVNSYADGITFEENAVDKHWLFHNFENIDDIGIATIRLEGKETGHLQPSGSIVSIGWENWEKVTAGCHNMDLLQEGTNAVYCPHSCWRQVQVEFEEIGVVGTSIELLSYSTG